MTTALTRKDIEKRLDHPLFGDAYVTGIAATVGVFALAGWGVGWGLLVGLAAGIAALFVLAITVGIASGDDPLAMRGPLIGSAVYAGIVAWVGHTHAGAPGLGLGAAVFAYLAVQIVRRHRALPRDAVALPPEPETAPALAAADAPPPTRAPLAGPVGVAAAELPPDLGADLRARVDAALEDFRQLDEILHDKHLLAHAAIDAPGMLAAAEEVALDLLRDVPRVHRVQTLAARRPDDAAARTAAEAATAALGKHADALRDAVSAAFRVLAAPQATDAADLREHTARLQALHSADPDGR